MSEIKQVTAQTLKSWLDNDQAVLIDVREQHEYDAAHIQEAVHIPLAQVQLDYLPDFAGKKLVFQCRSGKRSQTAAERISEQSNSSELYNLQGGILAWVQESFPVKGASC